MDHYEWLLERQFGSAISVVGRDKAGQAIVAQAHFPLLAKAEHHHPRDKWSWFLTDGDGSDTHVEVDRGSG
jgi:hypothetical protein